MILSPSTLIRLPRVLLEHPLPLVSPGLAPSLSVTPASLIPFTLTLGGVDKWQRTGDSTGDYSPHQCPGFTLDSLTTLAALLSLTERLSGSTLTYNQLFRTLTPGSTSCSAHHREALKTTLATLSSIDLQITPSSDSPPAFQSLLTLTPAYTRPIFGRAAPAFSVAFAPALLDTLNDPLASAPIHFPALISIRSRLARALYLILTTWAHYSRAHPSRPFRITLSRLLTHLSIPVPRYISQRRAFFFGHRGQSLFDALQNIPTPYGSLCLSLAESLSTNDDCLSVHFNEINQVATAPVDTGTPRPEPKPTRDLSGLETETKKIKERKETISLPTNKRNYSRELTPTPSRTPDLSSFRNLKIYEAWRTSGRTDNDFLARVGAPGGLTQEDLSLLLTSRINPSRCETFLTLAKKLLPQRTWLDLLGEAKYAALSPAPPKSPTGKLIAEILSSVKAAL